MIEHMFELLVGADPASSTPGDGCLGVPIP